MLFIFPYEIYVSEEVINICVKRNETALKELKKVDKITPKIACYTKEACEDRLELWRRHANLLYTFIVTSGVLLFSAGILINEMEKMKKAQSDSSPESDALSKEKNVSSAN